jgi:hypothetical protein
MTDGVGGNTVYKPINVDNNAKPSTSASPVGVSPGLLKPSPNTTWVETVGEEKVTRMGWQKAEVSQEAKDRREAALAAGTAITIGGPSPQIQAVTNNVITGLASRHDEPSGVASGAGPNQSVEDAHESTKKSLDAESKHDEQVAQAKEETLEKLHNEDLLKERLQQLATPQGTTAGAA